MADCAERVLPFFEEAYPNDDRPRKAIETCRTWVRTGMFRMTEIRGASLAAHDAARDARENDAACFAAHAAGQAVATAHVPQHAYSGANYALKSVAADDPTNAEVKITKERSWQSQHLSGHLRQEIMKRIMIQQKGKRMIVKIQKVRVSNPRLNESEGQNAAQWRGILRHYGKQFSTPQHFCQQRNEMSANHRFKKSTFQRVACPVGCVKVRNGNRQTF